MKSNFIKLIIIFFGVTALFSLQFPAYAQIVLDGSMGTAGELKGPDYNISSEYGYQAGSNLFHSFRDFNINTGESATFGGPDSVRNIISRVTGGVSSWIDGELRSTISGADIYLLNPSGVMFGANAALNISGSFHVSTADYLRMGESERFYTTPMKGEVLSAASPSAFGFLDHAAPITFDGGEIEAEEKENHSSGFSVPEGESISVIGGDIEMSGTYYKSTVTGKTELLGGLSARGGRINMVSAASEGEVVPTEAGLDVSSETPGNITLDHSLISVSGEASGDIFIRGGQFFATDSTLQADTEGADDGGVTDIRTETLSLIRSDVFSDTWGTGKGGSIMVQAADAVNISDFSKVFADATGTDSDAGDAGTVLIETKNLSLSGGGAVSSDTYEACVLRSRRKCKYGRI
jgi:filamentous hemagglutinin family protein